MSSESSNSTATNSTSITELVITPQVPTVQLAGNQISKKQWDLIDKEDPTKKPKIMHPTLGEVYEVRPGILAKIVSPEDQYQRHMKSFEGPKMPNEQLERRRFALMMSAKNSNQSPFEQALAKVSTLEQLDECVREHTKDVKKMDEIAKDKEQIDLLKHNEKEAKDVYDAMVKAGRILKLQEGEVIDKKYLSQKAVDRLRKDGMNVFITRPASDDKYGNQLKKNAEMALQFVEGKMQLDSLKNGVDENTPKEVVEDLRVAIKAATQAISLYQQEKDIITRDDGEEICVRANIEDYYKELHEQKFVFKDIREFLHEHAKLLTTAFTIQSQKANESFIFLETLEVALFVPRLSLLLIDQPMPRVVEFSKIYSIYTAAFSALQGIKLMPTNRAREAYNRKAKRSLSEMAKEENGDVKLTDSRIENSAPSWTQVRTTIEDVSEQFSRMRLMARNSLLQNVAALHRWYDFESKCHLEYSQKGVSETFNKRDLTSPDMVFTFDEIKSHPDILSLYFYRHLYNFMREFCVGVLHAYEFGILLQLEAYLPRHTLDHWRSRDFFPTNKKIPGVTKKLVKENNEKLFGWRNFESKTITDTLKKVMLVHPPVSAEYIDKLVGDEDCSPTFRDMIQYHKDMNSLFILDDKQFKAIRREYIDRQKEKERAEQQSNLDEFVKMREKADAKEKEEKK